MGLSEDLKIREYGNSGPVTIVLHGGPAASGEAAPLARGLADSFRVIEPWQRGSGKEPLTVARHVSDLHDIVEARCGGARPALVGESWGAMLALAYAASHPGSAGSVVLIGCGTFDTPSRNRLGEILEARMDNTLRRRIERLGNEFPDPGERLKKTYALMRPLYEYDAVATEAEETGPFDLRAHTETWKDMIRLQEAGVYPSAFAAVDVPVLMLHGAYDPHPGRMIRESLEPFLPQMEYREFERCGHSPWLEKNVRDEFFAVLREWLLLHSGEGESRDS